MSQLTVEAAVEQALFEEMQRDPRVLVFGEGVATLQHRLLNTFGPERVRNTPLSEAVLAGTAVGAAATGLRPVVDMLYAPFLTYAMDAIVNSAGKLRYMSDGQFSFPLVILAKTGAGWCVGAQHSHNIESWFVHSPGLKVVMPSTSTDFKGLLKSAVRDDNPVLFFTDMTLGTSIGEVDDDAEQLIPIGQASICRSGRDVTLVSYAKTVQTCLQAAQTLSEAGIEAEVIDLRTLKPLDETTVLASVRRTGRLVVVHEAGPMCSLASEIAALVAEKAFTQLKSPVRRITSPDVPTPAAWALEQAFLPQAGQIEATVKNLLD